jgi:hypothetical protein
MPKSERSLTNGELAQARRIFLKSLDYAKPRIIEGKAYFFQPDNTAMAPDGNVYFPSAIHRADFSASASSMGFLIHELTHVWQVQKGVWLRTRRIFVDGGDYDYALDPARRLQDYKVEEQASLVADYYRILRGLKPQHGSGARADYAKIVSQAMS